MLGAVAIALYLLWKKYFSPASTSVSTSVSGQVTPDANKYLNYSNVGLFAPVANPSLPEEAYAAGAAPIIPDTLPLTQFPFDVQGAVN